MSIEAALIERMKAVYQMEIERLRDALRDIHDDFNASYPWAYQFEDTTIDDFLESGRKMDNKAFNALYPEKAKT